MVSIISESELMRFSRVECSNVFLQVLSEREECWRYFVFGDF